MRTILALIILFSPIQASSRDWTNVIAAIAKVESNNNPNARSGDAVGLLQIRPILVKDVNRILKLRKSDKRYTLADRYNPQKSKEIFVIYQSFYNPRGDTETAIRLWCGGCNYTKRGTENYYRKVKKEM